MFSKIDHRLLLTRNWINWMNWMPRAVESPAIEASRIDTMSLVMTWQQLGEAGRCLFFHVT